MLYQSKEMSNSLTEEENVEQESYLRRKKKARKSKKADKKSTTLTAAVFDLQQVMICPKLSNGSSFYLRKLSVYNLTVLKLNNMAGYCYTWAEIDGKRGTNEIATALITWLREQDEQQQQHIVLYSDSCGGQNRNKIMCTALINFLRKAEHTLVIEQKFFESGHSKSECDSMHSAIERQFRNKDIHLPSQYRECMLKANKKGIPYQVKEFSCTEFEDYEQMNKEFVKQNAFSGIISVHHIIYEKITVDDVPDVTVTFRHLEMKLMITRNPLKIIKKEGST